MPSAGDLKDRLEVLELKQNEAGNWSWSCSRNTWAQVTPDIKKRDLFSSVGIGARAASVILRRQPLTMGHALRWNGQHLFLTAILPGQNRGWLQVRAALCSPVECQKDAHLEAAGIKFPGVLTEKYIGHEQLDPLAVVTRDYVLVTPKPVTLAPGSWVICSGEYYRVLVPHELDEYKNEYEIRRKEDC
ncbi:MAG: hypothetical protein SOZ47_07340 [Lawsonibacter sp.]|nr:hypothetical protein [Lawsonibacter sp.]